MATTTYKITNAKEAAAAELATATYYLSRVEAAHALMISPEAQAFEAKVAELLADDLPPGTSAAINMPQVAKWFVDVRAGLDADLAPLDRLVNPPAPNAEDGPVEPNSQ